MTKKPIKKKPAKKKPTKKPMKKSAGRKPTKKPARHRMPVVKADYFMGVVPEGQVKEFREEIQQLLELDKDFDGAGIMVDVSLAWWEPDSSSEVIVDLSSTSRFVDLDAALDQAVEIVKVKAKTLEVIDPKTGDKLPVVFEDDELRKQKACVCVNLRKLSSRAEIQIELYLSTTDPEREWKDEA